MNRCFLRATEQLPQEELPTQRLRALNEIGESMPHIIANNTLSRLYELMETPPPVRTWDPIDVSISL